MHVLALLHNVSGELRHVRRRLEILPELDPLPLALLLVRRRRKKKKNKKKPIKKHSVGAFAGFDVS